MGGIRKGSGRSKTGYYKGIYCGSTYELCWVIYNLENNISFCRFPGFLTDGNIKYYPDFILTDTSEIVEIKGYETEVVKIKTQIAIDNGYKIKVLYKKDLKHIFDYVENKYHTTKFYLLYDIYNPKYNLNCMHCLKNYNSERKPKKTNFCSRICCGKYRKKQNENNFIESGKKTRFKPKLSEEQILSILNDQDSYSMIAKKFNIHKSAVGFIKKKRRVS